MFEGFSFDDFVTESTDFTIKKVRKYERIFKVNPGGSVDTKPVIHNNRVYFAATDSNIYCIDAKTGNEIWRFKMEAMSIDSTPVIHNDIIYIGSYDGHLYAITIDGNLLWKFKTGAEVLTKPVISENIISFGSKDGYVYGLDISNGKELWRFKTGDWVASALSLDKNKVFVGSFDSNLYCLDIETGKEIWRFRTGAEVFNVNPFLIHNGVIYFASLDSYLYAVDIESGKEIWRFRTGKYGNSASPVLCKDFIIQASRDGFLYAITFEGKEKWRFNYEKVVGPPIVYDERIYVGGEDYFLCCLNLDGKELWRFRAGHYIFWLSEIWENTIYLGSWDCHLYAVDADTGKEKWRFATSTTQQSYIPPPYEAWEIEIKIPKASEEEIEEEEKYEVNISGGFKDEYGTKSEYQVKTEYRQKMKY